MNRAKKQKGGMWEYLESSGVLEKGTDEEIKLAKKAYRKGYYLKYKQNQRQHKPEFTVNFSNEKGKLLLGKYSWKKAADLEFKAIKNILQTN